MNKYERMVKAAQATPLQEVCGFVGCLRQEAGAPGGGEELLFPVPNVHSNPRHNFAMDHEFQNKVLNNPSIVVTGMYHSHNHGSPYPSLADRMSRPTWDGTQDWDYFIIFQGREVWNWQFEKRAGGVGVIGSRVA